MITHSVQYCKQKANQHWEMAGLARMDGDKADVEKHTRLARFWEHKALEV